MPSMLGEILTHEASSTQIYMQFTVHSLARNTDEIWLDFLIMQIRLTFWSCGHWGQSLDLLDTARLPEVNDFPN